MSSRNGPTLTVTPSSGLITETRVIACGGFASYDVITVVAESAWSDGTTWRSEARYLADESGAADLKSMPMDGYRMASPMGIVWSMRSDNPSPLYPPSSTDPLVVRLRATGKDGRSVEALLRQEFLAPGVTVQRIREPAVSGDLYRPAGPGPHPIIVYMNGSSGGINGPRAALFAAEGFACLALGVFNFEERPRYISRTPLEYFEGALKWVRASLAPADDFVAVSGISRGAEMSLLTAAYFPELVSAVVAYVPTATINGVASAGVPGESRSAPTWTFDDEELPNVWAPSTTADWALAKSYFGEDGARQTPAFISTLEDADALKRSLIPVEKIKCPVLLLSASDDGFWPSSLYAEMVARRMQAPCTHIDYPGAGHYIFYPHLPTTLITKKHAMSGLGVSAGGVPESNAVANERSYEAVSKFLAEARATHAMHSR